MSAACASSGQWQCLDGSCIDNTRQCDGPTDCPDGSDETAALCFGSRCPSWSFSCAYGACIASDKRCNGAADCADGSDERSSVCGDTTDAAAVAPVDRANRCVGRLLCRSGECVHEDVACDGKRDCTDGSDETDELCAMHYCPKFAFRCAYGGCVRGDAKCDGGVDCADGSDEIRCNDTVQTQPANAGQCRVVLSPNLRVYSEHDPQTDLSPGSWVDRHTTVGYRCSEGLTLALLVVSAIDDDGGGGAGEAVHSNRCLGGNEWSIAVPVCERRCSAAVLRSTSTQVVCGYNGITIGCDATAPTANIRPGTWAQISCATGYKKPAERRASDFVVCEGSSGRWTATPMRCDAICGVDASPTGTTYIVGGQTTNVARVPWHVGIYSDRNNPPLYQQICGGSILSNRLVVTAAHCFWNKDDGRIMAAHHYHVATGKTQRSYYATEPERVQKLAVREIRTETLYNDYKDNYNADLAVLVLDGLIEFHSYVLPICLELNLSGSDTYVEDDLEALVAGWGLTESNGESSKELKLLYLPTVSQGKCKRRVPVHFQQFVTTDKFCAGYVNQNQSVCQGDSGGGLMTWQMENNQRKYYLRGVVSSGVDNCDPNMYTVFTNVHVHAGLIQRVQADVARRFD